MQTILHGKCFLLCDELGDVTTGTEGAFARDTRHLSRLQVLVGGARPQALGTPWGPHHGRTFVQRNLRTANVPTDAVLLTREYLVQEAFFVRLRLQNLSQLELLVPLTLQLGADFNDIFVVKQSEFQRTGDATGDVGLGDGRPHDERPPSVDAGELVICGGEGERTFVSATRAPELDAAGTLHWHQRIAAGQSWHVDLRIGADRPRSPLDERTFEQCRGRLDAEHRAWVGAAPSLSGAPLAVADAWDTAVVDLGALRIDAGDHADAMLPAAGLPWFMTVFGRDTCITCLQSMLLAGERARPALANLARLQAERDDPQADAEPGKILHELREGGIADRGYSVYYGSADSTPLFLILLDEIHRWTGDDEFVVEHRDHALRALEWLERHGDLDGDGYVEYNRRAEQGIDNQSWKDSWDSQRFADGRMAGGPIAPAEIQGYAFDARVRLARLAEQVWGDTALARDLHARARQLRERFNRDFWIAPDEGRARMPGDPRSAGFYAMALDGDKRPVDSLCSNIGHLLWSGIVDDERVPVVARQLTSPALWNGFGVRTMSTLDAAYNPLAYHNGTVWPHDTSLCIAGLVRCGCHEEADQIARGLFEAAGAVGGRLPEVFAGLPREQTDHNPVPYPTTCSPQAWAAAAPVLVLNELLGIEPDAAERRLKVRDQPVPTWLEGVQLRGIRAFGERWQVRVSAGCARVERAT